MFETTHQHLTSTFVRSMVTRLLDHTHRDGDLLVMDRETTKGGVFLEMLLLGPLTPTPGLFDGLYEPMRYFKKYGS